ASSGPRLTAFHHGPTGPAPTRAARAGDSLHRGRDRRGVGARELRARPRDRPTRDRGGAGAARARARLVSRSPPRGAAHHAARQRFPTPPSPQVRPRRARAGQELLLPRERRAAEPARAQPRGVQHDRGGRRRRDVALSPAPRSLLGVASRFDQGPGARGSGGDGRKRREPVARGEPAAHPRSRRPALHAPGVTRKSGSRYGSVGMSSIGFEGAPEWIAPPPLQKMKGWPQPQSSRVSTERPTPGSVSRKKPSVS